MKLRHKRNIILFTDVRSHVLAFENCRIKRKHKGGQEVGGCAGALQQQMLRANASAPLTAAGFQRLCISATAFISAACDAL